MAANASSACNLTDDDDAWDWLYAMQPAYMSVVCLLGVVGNALVLCVFCLQRGGSTVADIYLGNLAVADLLMVSCLPFWVVTVVQRFHWRFGELMCRLVSIVIGMNYYCSVLFLMTVSVDRYLALARPLCRGRERRAACAWAVCLAIWALGILLSLPSFFFRSVRWFPEWGVEACYVEYPHGGWKLRYNLTVHAVGFLVPVPVVAFCSYHIVRVLREGGRAVRAGGRRERAAAGRERKAARLVLVVLAVFVLCWLPYQVVIFLDTLEHCRVIQGCEWEHILNIGDQLATYLGYSNSSLNPFLYVIVGKHFKQRAKEVFRQLASRGKQRSSGHTHHVHRNSATKSIDSTKV